MLLAAGPCQPQLLHKTQIIRKLVEAHSETKTQVTVFEVSPAINKENLLFLNRGLILYYIWHLNECYKKLV